MADHPSRSAGFTLLEVLVAFVILSALLGVVMRLNAQALNIGMRAAERQQALMLGRSQLDRILARRNLVPGTEQGAFERGDFHWSLEVGAFTWPERGQAQMDAGGQVYRITLTVYRGEAIAVQLTTLRLGVAS
ncbi:type IV pilus modification PilV family protein [Marinobacterium marinum]|uniref:Prepilin-type N-terminal cleavage/methylation domain-containing protein n=1 Tax=Marinobacterium marinum TaxID=2756129 RepID=A0A7W2AAZ7_9GAMM|nr:prepilin-type N-terminal cleavage/methylation domain-containing protein [Marinobacterium marinum]MBA4501555.1 prepilin-type N-terminal cleavage/methylation domain-containing protein [Marinobacterium marinum]